MAYPDTKKPFPKNGRGRFKVGPTGITSFSDEYRNLSFEQRHDKAALKASDNGRCWWIYKFVKIPIYTYEEKKHLPIDTLYKDN